MFRKPFGKAIGGPITYLEGKSPNPLDICGHPSCQEYPANFNPPNMRALRGHKHVIHPIPVLASVFCHATNIEPSSVAGGMVWCVWSHPCEWEWDSPIHGYVKILFDFIGTHDWYWLAVVDRRVMRKCYKFLTLSLWVKTLIISISIQYA